jgi:hypothetical protein
MQDSDRKRPSEELDLTITEVKLVHGNMANDRRFETKDTDSAIAGCRTIQPTGRRRPLDTLIPDT